MLTFPIYQRTLTIAFALFNPLPETVRVALPAVLPASTTTTSSPWKAFIVGLTNTSVEVASPLQQALNLAAPFTLKLSWLSASGQRLPSLSTTRTV